MTKQTFKPFLILTLLILFLVNIVLSAYTVDLNSPANGTPIKGFLRFHANALLRTRKTKFFGAQETKWVSLCKAYGVGTTEPR